MRTFIAVLALASLAACNQADSGPAYDEERVAKNIAELRVCVSEEWVPCVGGFIVEDKHGGFVIPRVILEPTDDLPEAALRANEVSTTYLATLVGAEPDNMALDGFTIVLPGAPLWQQINEMHGMQRTNVQINPSADAAKAPAEKQ